MKSIIFLFLSTLFLLLQQGVAQTLTQEEKDRILNNLQSSDYFERSDAIWAAKYYDIPESVPILESILWQQDRTLGAATIDALEKYNPENFVTLAHQFINSVDTLNIELVSFRSPLEIKVDINSYLFKRGDYSTFQYVFDLVEQKKPETFIGSVYLLKEIINNVQDYEEQAKYELIRIAKLQDRFGSGIALAKLEELYNEETVPIAIEVFINDTLPENRRGALDNLVKYNYPGLEELLKNRMIVDQSLTYDIVITLILHYGSISNYKFIQDNIALFASDVDKRLTTGDLKSFKPEIPDFIITLHQLINQLNSYTDTCYIYGWIGDNDFVYEIKNHLQASLSFLNNDDSLNTAKEISLFQNKVNEEYNDSLDGDNKFVYSGGWNFLYYNAQYILDRLPELPSESKISPYSLFSTHSLWLEQNSEVLSGDIGVNEAGSPPFLDSDVELSIGIGAATPAGYTVKGNRVYIKNNSVVNSDVYYNELTNNGTITGTQNTPLELPLVTSLPEFHSSTPGTQNIIVLLNGEQILQPGSYGDIEVKKNGRLIFAGGEYHINSFTGGDNNQIIFQSLGEVRIAGKFDSGQGSYIGAEDTTTMSAKDIVFYVAGINGSNGNLSATPKAAKIGISNIVKANFYVPNGTLWIRQNSEVEGAFIGKDVDVGIGVKVWLKSAF